jgi:hypothetical protein
MCDSQRRFQGMVELPRSRPGRPSPLGAGAAVRQCQWPHISWDTEIWTECKRGPSAEGTSAVRVAMRSKVRRLLARFDYPLDAEAKAIALVLEQADLFALNGRQT